MELEKLSAHQFKGISYVVITVADRDDKKGEKLTGLFGGVIPISNADTLLVSPEDMYICVLRDGTISFLSSLFHDVERISIGNLKECEPSTESTSVIKAFTKTDQTSAIEILKKIYEAMKLEGRLGEHDIIDDSKYSLPDDLKAAVAGSPSESNQRASNHVRSGGTSYWPFRHPGANSVHSTGNNTCGYQPKAVTTTVFVSTQKASGEEIASMRAKLKAIKDGTYEPPKLPTIPADTVEADKHREEKDTTVEKRVSAEPVLPG